jgi:hypothetical protein
MAKTMKSAKGADRSLMNTAKPTRMYHVASNETIKTVPRPYVQDSKSAVEETQWRMSL